MSSILEKVVFAFLPVLTSGVIYVISSMISMQEEILNLKAKVTVVVTDDNQPAMNVNSELEREKLRADLKELIAANSQAIAVLEHRLDTLEAK
jgi:hypothetical protein